MLICQQLAEIDFNPYFFKENSGNKPDSQKLITTTLLCKSDDLAEYIGRQNYNN
jgi:hypothetical protein